MVFHGALTDAQIGGDVFAGLAGQHAVQHLALAGGQAGDVASRVAAAGFGGVGAVFL